MHLLFPARVLRTWVQSSETRFMSSLSHVDPTGRASMVDVTSKQPTSRTAVASAKVMLNKTAFDLVKDNAIKKGDVLTTAQLAGIMGAKRTSELIPLCHPIALRYVDVNLTLDDDGCSVCVMAEARTTDVTGVEMEALTAASVAALTVYDMCKAVDKSITIAEVKLLSKSGGKSGDWCRE